MVRELGAGEEVEASPRGRPQSLPLPEVLRLRPGSPSSRCSDVPEADGGMGALPYEDGSEANGLEDPWNLARIAMGSLAGEPWRIKQALSDPPKAFELCPVHDFGSWWGQFQKTQTYDDFKDRLERPEFTNRTIDVVVLGDPKAVKEKVHLASVLTVLEAFIGFPASLRPSEVRLGDWALPRKAGDGREQVAAHLLLGQLEDIADPRSICTVGITAVDLYLPKGSHGHVSGATNSQHRVGVFSFARYFSQKPLSPKINPKGDSTVTPMETTSRCLIKVLCRECLKLCGMGECRLMRCLMNPCTGGRPEAVNSLPLSLCCICLRKLHWLSQVDLLDRYAHLPRVLSEWFEEETGWLKQRMVQVGMPTYGSLQTPKFQEPDPGKFPDLGKF